VLGDVELYRDGGLGVLAYYPQGRVVLAVGAWHLMGRGLN